MFPLNKNTTDGTDKFVTTYYVRDPQGNVLAVYEHKHGDSGDGTFTLTEQHLYGASRLGMTKPNLVLSGTGTGSADPTAPAVHYELTNHLGNVLAVITPDASDATQPAIESLTDYYPFGMTEPGRSWNSGDYRFGYTGHEKENDLAEGVYITEYRLLDTRLGRWLSVDPLYMKYPGMSSYNYCGGNPMALVDQDGRDPIYRKPFLHKHVKVIGDDGKKSSGSYLVKGSVARAVKKATKNGKFYAGDLSESKKVMHVPTGEKLQGVIESFEDTKVSKKENGGHAYVGDKSVTRWDEGAQTGQIEEEEDANGNRTVKYRASMSAFKVNGRSVMPKDASNLEMWWHVHPDDSRYVESIGANMYLGSSDPSPADYKFQKKLEAINYKGNTFVVGVGTLDVTFFKGKGRLKTVLWTDFIKMGKQEK